MPNCPCCRSSLEERAVHTFYYSVRVRPFLSHVKAWTARIKSQQLCAARRWLRRGPYLPSVSSWGSCGVSRDPSCGLNGDLDDAKEENICRCKLFSSWSISFFRHQLGVKIWCDRKRLDRITFDKRWVLIVSLVVQKGATLESSFPSLPVHGDDGPGPYSW